jgi:hypothetical protein
MPSIDYSLYRAKFIKPSQRRLFADDLQPWEFFLRALEERPNAQPKEGYIWHIGKLELFSEHSGTFKIGRTARGTVEKFDESSGDFLEEEQETSPYTHCVFDVRLGLIGIARKAALAPDADGIAARVRQILSKALIVRRNNISVEVVPIPDPEDFLKALDSAYQVTSFTATFGGPNPFDADAYFQRPQSRLLSVAGGTRGKTQIQGANLDREVLQSLTRSTASTGNKATARVKKKKADKTVTIKLEGGPISVGFDKDAHNQKQVLTEITSRYLQVRAREEVPDGTP